MFINKRCGWNGESIYVCWWQSGYQRRRDHAVWWARISMTWRPQYCPCGNSRVSDGAPMAEQESFPYHVINPFSNVYNINKLMTRFSLKKVCLRVSLDVQMLHKTHTMKTQFDSFPGCNTESWWWGHQRLMRVTSPLWIPTAEKIIHYQNEWMNNNTHSEMIDEARKGLKSKPDRRFSPRGRHGE
jgi:hypothetical protein